MKKGLLFIVTLLICAAANAAPVTKSQAFLKAQAFLQQVRPQAALIQTSVEKAPRKVNGKTVENEAYYWVFNTENDNGFVIVAGDDIAIPILGYSDSGSFDADNVNPEMQWWLDSYAAEIEWAKSQGIETVVSYQDASNKSDIAKLCSTTWDQSKPYNLKCPQSGRTYCYTGCVATAMAQVMKKWNHPSATTTLIPSYTASSLNTTVGPVSSGTSFTWSKMTNSYSSSSTDNTGVSTLMFACGVSVEMDYSTSGSGASETDIPYALKTYFDYADCARLVYRTDMTADGWADAIYNDLAKGYPVIMCGAQLTTSSSSSASLSGHCFVCDGYQASSDKYHFNWGWSGSGDGYFALTALAPSTTGSGGGTAGEGYDYMKSAILGIVPNDQATADDYKSAGSSLYCPILFMTNPTTLTRDARAYDASQVSLFGYLGNFSGTDASYDYGVAVYNDVDSMIFYDSYASNRLFSTHTGAYYFASSFDFGEELPYGDYRIQPVARETTDDNSAEWQGIGGGWARTIKATVEDDGTTINLAPATDITAYITNAKGSSGSSRSSYSTTLTITNNGTEEWSQPLAVYVGSSSGTTLKNIVEPVVGAGETTTVDLGYSSALSTSNYMYIVPFYGPGYSVNILCIYPTDYASASLEFSNFNWHNYIDTSDGWKLFDNKYNGSLYVMNYGQADFNETIHGVIYPTGGSFSGSGAIAVDKTVTVGPMKEAVIDFEFEGLTYGTAYSFIAYTGTGTSEGDTIVCLGEGDYSTYSLTATKGIVAIGDEAQYLADSGSDFAIADNCLFVDATHSDKYASITPSSYPNCIYYLPEGASAPSSLAGKNVVIGSTAANIEIQDTCDFYPIYDFTAQNISYIRTMDDASNDGVGSGTKWSTIMLPFAVNNGVHDNTAGKDIDWFRSESDTEKNFWVMDFVADNEYVASYDYATSMEAYTPYILTVPNTKWGDDWKLTDHELVFKGTNATITAYKKGVKNVNTKKYDFIGRTYTAARGWIYMMADDGRSFEYTKDWYYIQPFRAYMVGYYNNENTEGAKIQIRWPGDDETTGIGGITAEENTQNNDVYTIGGVKMNKKANLEKGVYIVNGKKVIK